MRCCHATTPPEKGQKGPVCEQHQPWRWRGRKHSASSQPTATELPENTKKDANGRKYFLNYGNKNTVTETGMKLNFFDEDFSVAEKSGRQRPRSSKNSLMPMSQVNLGFMGVCYSLSSRLCGNITTYILALVHLKSLGVVLVASLGEAPGRSYP